MENAKELWSGAGLWLDVPQITSADFDVVKRRLEEIGATQAKISFLKRLQIEFDDAAVRHFATLLFVETPRGSAERDDFLERKSIFDSRIAYQLNKLEKIREVEEEEERSLRDAKAPTASEGSEADPTASKAAKMIASKELGPVKPLTAAQRVWLFHFLLTEAGMKEDELQKADIARFIVSATGSEPGKVYDHVMDPEQETQRATYRDLTAVRSWFERLKMAEMVKKVDQERKNFEGSGT